MNNNELQVEFADIVRVVLQFLKENQLYESFTTLQDESKVALNTVDNMEGLFSDITNGKWDIVLKTIAPMKFPYEKLANLYEQIVIELIELREIETARAILREEQNIQKYKSSNNTTTTQNNNNNTAEDTAKFFSSEVASVIGKMKTVETQRYLRLERLLQKPFFDETEVYLNGATKSSQREKIAQEIKEEILIAPPSRLLSMITQSLRWQQLKGILPAGVQYDLFRQVSLQSVVQPETYPTRLFGQIAFSNKSYPEVCVFTNDGQSLITGSVDGFIEIWNYLTCKIRKDLSYQAQDKYMRHNGAVMALSCSKDGEFLASGSSTGEIKVWQISSGKCLRKFPQAHVKGITALHFASVGQSSQLLSSSQDHTVRIHGIKSGKTMTILRGHTSFVNDCCYSSDESKVISCSSDGTVKIWDAKKGDCLSSFTVSKEFDEHTAVYRVSVLPNSNTICVCNRSPIIYFMNIEGQILKKLENPIKKDFMNCMLSPKGMWVYGATEDGKLLCFNSESGELVHELQVNEKEIKGSAHHPHRNLIATNAETGVKLWKPVQKKAV